MISVNDFINSIYIPYNEHAGYIWGSYGQVHTKADQQRATREQTIKWGSKWIGKRCWDCSGLIYWAFRLYGESIYHGSNTMWHKHCTEKGELYNGSRTDNEPLKIGTAVFMYRKSDDNRHHVGVYVGNGKCIEAKGTYYGVVMSDVSQWDEWGELKGVDYSQRVVVDMESLRIGMKSDKVKELQTRLNALGYDCGNADSIFGSATKSAVIAFQRNNGLTADGIVGEKTMSALDSYFNHGSGSGSSGTTSTDNTEKIIELLRQIIEMLKNKHDEDDGK